MAYAMTTHLKTASPSLWTTIVCVLTSSSAVLFSPLNARNDLAKDVAQLGHDNFEIREAALKRLLNSQLTENDVKRLIKEAKDPEIQARLERIRDSIYQFIPYQIKAKLPTRAKPQGREADGKKLYLMRAKYRGKLYVGKYSPDHRVAYIPVDGKEVAITEGIEIHAGGSLWLVAKKSKNPLVIGKTKKGQSIFAIRIRHAGGIHTGMLVEGEKLGRVPYGGSALPATDYEVLQK